MQAGVGLLDTDVMPICIIIALDIVITLHVSINCSTVIRTPTILFAFKREASSETYGPRVYFPSYLFPIYYFAIFYFQIYKPKNPKIFSYLLFSFIYLYQISPLQVTMKGLTTPLSRWVQVFDCLCRCIDWRLACISYRIDTLVLNCGKYLSLLCCITLSSSREKPTQAQEVAGRISGAVAREIYIKPTKYPA